MSHQFQEFQTEISQTSEGLHIEKFDIDIEPLASDEYLLRETNETFSISGFTVVMKRSPTPY